MTKIAALDWCQNFSLNILDCIEKHDERYMNALESMVICKESIEKQIPETPIKEYIDSEETFEKYINYYCPACESYLSSTHKRSYKNYCCDCGKAILWDNEE